MGRWRVWEHDACVECNGTLELFTEAEEGSCHDGDTVRCLECGRRSSITTSLPARGIRRRMMGQKQTAISGGKARGRDSLRESECSSGLVADIGYSSVVANKLINCIKRHQAMYLTGPSIEDVSNLTGLDERAVSKTLAAMELDGMVASKVRGVTLRFFCD